MFVLFASKSHTLTALVMLLFCREIIGRFEGRFIVFVVTLVRALSCVCLIDLDI